MNSRGPTRTHRGDDVAYDLSFPDLFQFLSSTQMKQFRECNRKWFFTTQRKIDVGSTAAMRLGSEVHEILEDYAKTGEGFYGGDSKAHEIAYEALQYLPEWGTDWQPEVNLADPSQGPQLFLAGVPFVSYADLYVPARFDNGELELPLIVDYKTTSALHWAKNEEQLKKDIQGVAYARWALEKSYKIDWALARGNLDQLERYQVRVKFPWLLTKGKSLPRSQCTDFVMSAADTVEPWAGFERDVRMMLDLAWKAQRGELQDREVPGNYSSCDSWGGCPHRERCAQLTQADLAKQLVQLRPSKERPVNKSLSDLLGTKIDLNAAPLMELIEPGVRVIQSPGFDLFVDAVPLRGVSQVTLLEDYLAPLNAQIMRDYNAAKGTNMHDVLEVDFGKWKGPLRALLVQNPPCGAVVARSQGETSQVALEVLKPLARTVIQGVR